MLEAMKLVVKRVIMLLVVGHCDNSFCEKDWRCCKCGVQAACARQGDLAVVTPARPCASHLRARISAALECLVESTFQDSVLIVVLAHGFVLTAA